MKSETLVEIGDLLRAARKGLGLTQEQVAEMAGISRPRYREIETGSSAARATTLVNIARALGLELMFIPQSMVPLSMRCFSRMIATRICLRSFRVPMVMLMPDVDLDPRLYLVA